MLEKWVKFSIILDSTDQAFACRLQALFAGFRFTRPCLEIVCWRFSFLT